MTLLAEAVELLDGFHNDCENPITYLGRVRLRSWGNGSGRRTWMVRGSNGRWHVPSQAEWKRIYPRIRREPCGRCWDCRRRAFLAKAAA